MVHIAVPDLRDNFRTETQIIQSKLGTEGLGEATIKAQQELAEKFNIVTFDIEGNISTVPLTTTEPMTIDVGTGRFTSDVFRKSVEVLQTKLRPQEPQMTFFDTFFARPITKLIDVLFNTQSLEDLTPEQQERIRLVDLEIEAARNKLQELRNIRQANLDKKLHGGMANRRKQDRLDQQQQDINTQTRVVNNLVKKRESLFREFAASSTLKDEMLSLTKEMQGLAQLEPLTAELKASMDTLIKEGSAIIESMLREGADIQQQIVSELQRAMLELTFRIKEPITNTATELKIDLGFIGDSLFGIGTLIADAFDRIFNPPAEELKNQLIRFGIAQRLAAAELAKL